MQFSNARNSKMCGTLHDCVESGDETLSQGKTWCQLSLISKEGWYEGANMLRTITYWERRVKDN